MKTVPICIEVTHFLYLVFAGVVAIFRQIGNFRTIPEKAVEGYAVIFLINDKFHAFSPFFHVKIAYLFLFGIYNVRRELYIVI